jgi:hypothetical protein
MAIETYVTIPVTPEIARQLPPDVDDLSEVLTLGLQSWRVTQALAAYQRGRGTLAYAAEQAGVSLREMIALAYAHGLQPKDDPRLVDQPLSLGQACQL